MRPELGSHVVQQRYDYDVFGTPQNLSYRQNIDSGYTGKPYDGTTGLSDYGFRDYAPQMARFTTVDPIRDGNNWYAYVNNDPVNWVDAWGLEEVYFIYTYSDKEKDIRMKKAERSTINDDITYLKDNGISVKVIEKGTKQDIINALEDPEAKVIMTSGHGYEMNKTPLIIANDKSYLTPKDVDKNKISENLSTVILANCHQGGKNKQQWEKALGDTVNVVAWEKTMTVAETKRFNRKGRLDRQSKSLREYLEQVVNGKSKKETSNQTKGNKNK